MAEDSKTLQMQEQKYYSSDNVNSAYKELWGEGNIHCGFFPHLEDDSAAILTFAQAGERVTAMMGELSAVDENSRVLDLGCGFGKPLIDLCQKTKCSGVGLDLTKENIDKCNIFADGCPGVKVEFRQGSFLEAASLFENEEKFTHVFSQYAFCHVHDKIEEILANCYGCLAPNGVLVVLDYLGPKDGSDPSELTRKHCYERLHFTKLIGHDAYKAALQKTGFEIVKYLNLDKHAAYGYGTLGKVAKEKQFKKENGEPLYLDYEYTEKAANNQEVGQNLFIAKRST